jgi:hypothetical protein
MGTRFLLILIQYLRKISYKFDCQRIIQLVFFDSLLTAAVYLGSHNNINRKNVLTVSVVS